MHYRTLEMLYGTHYFKKIAPTTRLNYMEFPFCILGLMPMSNAYLLFNAYIDRLGSPMSMTCNVSSCEPELVFWGLKSSFWGLDTRIGILRFLGAGEAPKSFFG